MVVGLGMGGQSIWIKQGASLTSGDVVFAF